MVSLMDRLLKKENLDLKLTPYRVLATSSDDGMMEFVPSVALATVRAHLYFCPPAVSSYRALLHLPLFPQGLENYHSEAPNDPLGNWSPLEADPLGSVEQQDCFSS